MIRTLFIIAGAALVLCLVTLGGAAALGGHDLQRHGWSWTLKDNNGESVRFERIKGGGTEDLGPITTRSLPWTGGEALKIESAINVEYVQGPENTVVITGPKGLADRVRLEDGRLYLANGDERVVFGWNNGTLSARSERDELKVVVTTPNVRRFEVSGSSDLSVTNFDQPSLAVAISGSADVTVTGRTDALDLSISGSGDAYLDDLKTTDATVNVAGSGTAQIAPTGKASITISGSGDVDLSTRPAQLVTNVSGSGSISQG